MQFISSHDYLGPPSAAHIEEFISFLSRRGGIVWSVALNTVEDEIAMAAHQRGLVKLSDDGRAFFLPDCTVEQVHDYLVALDRRLQPEAVARFLREADPNVS